MDKSTETGFMATIHCYLRNMHEDIDDPADTVIYGPSMEYRTEWFWKELHERMEQHFKDQLKRLLEYVQYDRDNQLHR